MHYESVSSNPFSHGKRKGSAVIVLLVLLALVGGIYLATFLLKEKYVDPDVVHDLTPWKEWRMRMMAKGEGEEGAEEVEIVEIFEPIVPSAEQVDINEGLYYDMNAKQKGAKAPGGEIEINFGPSGSVGGRWYGQYYRKGKNDAKVGYNLMGAPFGGFICPQRICQNEYGEDTSKLYFIAKGDFMIERTNYDVGTVKHMAGAVYVIGWLNKDQSISGEITITSDEKYSECFTFEAKEPMPPERMGGGMPAIF